MVVTWWIVVFWRSGEAIIYTEQQLMGGEWGVGGVGEESGSTMGI